MKQLGFLVNMDKCLGCYTCAMRARTCTTRTKALPGADCIRCPKTSGRTENGLDLPGVQPLRTPCLFEGLPGQGLLQTRRRHRGS